MDYLFIKMNVQTNKNIELLDITDLVNEKLQKSQIGKGICHIFIKDINTALTTSPINPEEELEVASILGIKLPDLISSEAIERKHQKLTPISTHIIAAFLGSFISIPFENKQLILGLEQRVGLVEFSGPKEHELILEFK